MERPAGYRGPVYLWVQRDDKPGYVVGDHLSRPAVTGRLKQPTCDWTGRPLSRFGLASDGVYMCPSRYRAGGSLLHCPSTLTNPKPGGSVLAVYFCCTFPGVASAGRYPASCPVKPGLSSPDF